jgi:hypothetical protein
MTSKRHAPALGIPSLPRAGTRGSSCPAAVAISLALLAAPPFGAPGSEARAGEEPVSPAIARLFADLDAAFDRGDLDALMAPFAADFRSPCGGGLSREGLRELQRNLLTMMPEAECATRIVHVRVGVKGLRQVLAERAYLMPGVAAPLELQCLSFMIDTGGEPPRTRIIGLEEYDCEALACLVADRFASRRTGLSFDVAPELLVTPAPRLCALEKILLRAPDLSSEIRVVLRYLKHETAIDDALHHDLREFEQERGTLETIAERETKLAGFPARRAEIAYVGGACAMNPDAPPIARRLTRIYCAIGERLLLAVDCDRPAAGAEAMAAQLERLLASLQFASRDGAEVLAHVQREFGFGPIVDRKFRDERSGFALALPAGYSLERVPTAFGFELVVTPRAAPAVLRIGLNGYECLPEAEDRAADPALDALAASAGMPPAIRAIRRVHVAGREIELTEIRSGERASFTAAFECGSFRFALDAESPAGNVEALRRSVDEVLSAIRIGDKPKR